MGEYTVIDDVEDTLKRSLESGLKKLIKDPVEVLIESQNEVKDDAKNIVSLFLYQIVENNFMKNEELQRVDNDKLQNPPLALDLMYLVTTYGKDRKLILGAVMQILYDNAVFKGKILNKNLVGKDEIKIFFNPLSLDDLTKIWGAFKNVPYRLSVSYMISPVRIESATPMDITRVESKEVGYYYLIPKEEEE